MTLLCQSTPEDDLACIENLLDVLQLEGATENLRSVGGNSFGMRDSAVVNTRELCDVLGLSQAMASLSANSDVEAWDKIFDRLCEDDLDSFPGMTDVGKPLDNTKHSMDLLLTDLDEAVGAEGVDTDCNNTPRVSQACPTTLDCQASLRLSLHKLKDIRAGVLDSDIPAWSEVGGTNSWDALLLSARGLLLSARSSGSKDGQVEATLSTFPQPPPPPHPDPPPPPPQPLPSHPLPPPQARMPSKSLEDIQSDLGPGTARSEIVQYTGQVEDIQSVIGPGIASMASKGVQFTAAMRDFAVRVGELEEEGDPVAMQRFLHKFILGVHRRLSVQIGAEVESTTGSSNTDESEARTVAGAESDEENAGGSVWSLKSVDG